MLTKVKPILRFHALMERNLESTILSAISMLAVTNILVSNLFIKNSFLQCYRKELYSFLQQRTQVQYRGASRPFVQRQHPIRWHFTHCPYSDKKIFISAGYCILSIAFLATGIIQPPTALPKVFTNRNTKALPLHIPAIDM